MGNLKEVRTRILSVQSTKQITSAMKLVSASKLNRAQNAILNLRPYSAKMLEIMHHISSNVEDMKSNPYAGRKNEAEKTLIVPITSNRGLCGAFNANVIKRTIQIVQNELQGKDYDLFCIGKNGADYFKRYEYSILGINTEIFDDLSFDHAVILAENFMKLYADKAYSRIILVYNKFKNAATQVLMKESFLPIEGEIQEDNKEENHKNEWYIFEPSKKEILEALIPKTLKVQFYKALLDSYAAEHGARMTAMHQATENADELLKDLKLSYNKARQAAITNEILEIVSGANALKE